MVRLTRCAHAWIFFRRLMDKVQIGITLYTDQVLHDSRARRRRTRVSGSQRLEGGRYAQGDRAQGQRQQNEAIHTYSDRLHGRGLLTSQLT